MASTKPKPRFVPKQSEEGPRKCARAECGKTVYQLEELKCLDKIWHKQCFRCSVCNMLLNMKNYKGYNKMPYCEPHYPKTVATAVKDTPEMLRVAENTKNQSMVQYHLDYEKTKGKKTDVTDDPETQRHVKNMQVVSQAAYTHEQEKKNEMEKSRPTHEPINKIIEGKYVPKSPTEAAAPQIPTHGAKQDTPVKTPKVDGCELPQTSNAYYGGNDVSSQGGTAVRPVGSIADYDPLAGNWGSAAKQQQQQKNSAGVPSPVIQAAHPAPQQKSPPGKSATGKKCIAIYDYAAADTDEVSFSEGDILLNCQSVDEGWLTGTVQRTKQWGMVPANYVQPYKLEHENHSPQCDFIDLLKKKQENQWKVDDLLRLYGSARQCKVRTECHSLTRRLHESLENSKAETAAAAAENCARPNSRNKGRGRGRKRVNSGRNSSGVDLSCLDQENQESVQIAETTCVDYQKQIIEQMNARIERRIAEEKKLMESIRTTLHDVLDTPISAPESGQNHISPGATAMAPAPSQSLELAPVPESPMDTSLLQDMPPPPVESKKAPPTATRRRGTRPIPPSTIRQPRRGEVCWSTRGSPIGLLPSANGIVVNGRLVTEDQMSGDDALVPILERMRCRIDGMIQMGRGAHR